jgi:hypothetical protein
MLSPKSDIYIKEILSYVKFTFDRADIRAELECHISDKMEYYIEHGYDEEQAEQLSIKDMGNAKEIGVELNKQHNPIIGCLWRITNLLAVLTITIFTLIFMFFMSSFIKGDLVDKFPKSDIVYKIDLNEQVKIDDRVIKFTNVIYDKNGDMNIYYKSYYTRLWGTGWSLGYIGEITDNLGNKYTAGSGQQNGGIICKGVWKVDHFSDVADMLIISYDMYNRKYRVEIPLKEGENND